MTEVKPVREYPCLSANFFRGTFPGQVASVLRTLETKPEKARDFLAAIEKGVIMVPLKEDLPTRTVKGLLRLGIGVEETPVTLEEIEADLQKESAESAELVE